MPEETHHSWKRREIPICTIPVRHIISGTSAPDGYVASVRVEAGGTVLADWHLLRFVERWSSAGEARRAAFEYVVKLVDRGVFGAPAAPALATAEGLYKTGDPGTEKTMDTDLQKWNPFRFLRKDRAGMTVRSLLIRWRRRRSELKSPGSSTPIRGGRCRSF